MALAVSPLTTRVAEAGPVEASSDGVDPVIFGKSAGRVSQMRPHAVSVWPAVDPPLGPTVGADDAPAGDGTVDAAADAARLGDDDVAVDVHAASAKVAARPRPITLRQRGERRMSVEVMLAILPRDAVGPSPG
jgi:hypothetical protein